MKEYEENDSFDDSRDEENRVDVKSEENVDEKEEAKLEEEKEEIKLEEEKEKEAENKEEDKKDAENKEEDRKELEIELEEDKVWYKAVQGDATITEVNYDPKEYTEKTTDLEKNAYVKAGAFTNLFEDLSTDLKGVLEGFRNAQVNKDANFVEGAGTEGPKDYRNIIKSIQEVVSIIDNETKNVPVDQLVKKTQNMFKFLAKYEKEHKPNIRGHRSVESAKRYEIISKFNEIRTPFVQMVNVIGTETKKAIGSIQDELDFLDNKEGYIDFTTTSLADLKTSIFEKRKEDIVKNKDEADVLEELDADARAACDYYKLNTQKKFYKDRILNYLREHTRGARRRKKN